MGLLEDVQKAKLPEQEPQSLLAQVQAATLPEADQLPAPELTEPGRPVGPEELAAIKAPTDPEEAEKARFVLELGGGIAASLVTGGALPAIARVAPTLAKIASKVPLGKLAAFSAGAGFGEGVGSLAAESFDPSKSPVARARQAARRGAIGEATGLTFFRGVGAVFGKRGIGELEKGAETAIRLITQKGGVVTPGLASKSWAVDFLENIAEASITGGKRIRKTKAKAADLAQEGYEEFVATYARGGTKEDVGALIEIARENADDAFRAVGADLYTALDGFVSGARVSIQPEKIAAIALRKRVSAGVRTTELKGLIDEFLKKDDFLPFADAQELRSSLLAELRVEKNPKAKAAIGELSGLIDRAMERSAKQLKGPALAAWRAANFHWAQGSKIFNGKLLQAIARQEPQTIFRTSIKGANPGDIRTLRKVIEPEEPATWKAVQSQILADFTKKASSRRTGEISGDKVLKQLDTFGDDSFVEAFSRQELKNFEDWAGTLALVQGKASQGTPGGMLIQLTQGGAIIGLMAGKGLKAAASATLVIPFVMSHLFTNKLTVKLFREGVTAPAGSQAATRAFGQLAALVTQERFKLAEEARRPFGPIPEDQPRRRPSGLATFGGPQAPR